ncbi:MAG TPA: L-threonylcarbamoyladenylate synthase [Nitrospiraceae bacterium]|jgi:L-threonylcarbamoyladenylate synthase|nr:L-threonylcarbamoyladenylate synthase [Nitrospiraceae bacterium]
MTGAMATKARVLPCPQDFSEESAREIVQVVQAGGVVAVPTESFYALGVVPTDATAVARVRRIKGERGNKPILVLIADHAQLGGLVAGISPAAQALIDRFWPGPLTIIFPALPSLPAFLTAGTGSVGIRLTAYPLLAALLRRVGPLTGTSANRSGQPQLQTAQAVNDELGSDVDLTVDGGPTPGGLPSTVVDSRGPIVVVREGQVSRAELATVLKHAGLRLS